MLGSFFASVYNSMHQLVESVVNRPLASAVGGILGAMWGYAYAALPVELPVVIALTTLVLVDQRTGIRAARARGEQIISHVTRTRLGNKAASYTEMYLVGLAAKTLSPTATVPILGEIGVGGVIYGLLMGIIVSVEVWSILENHYILGTIPYDPSSGPLKALRDVLIGRLTGADRSSKDEEKMQ